MQSSAALTTPNLGIIALIFAELPRREETAMPGMSTADLQAIADAAALNFFGASTRELLAGEADAWASFESINPL